MSYSKESQDRYRKKCKTFAVKFTPKEAEESRRLQDYLTDTRQSANAYIKNLIKKDLDEKGI